jgi:hypothetical protein
LQNKVEENMHTEEKNFNDFWLRFRFSTFLLP